MESIPHSMWKLWSPSPIPWIPSGVSGIHPPFHGFLMDYPGEGKVQVLSWMPLLSTYTQVFWHTVLFQVLPCLLFTLDVCLSARRDIIENNLTLEPPQALIHHGCKRTTTRTLSFSSHTPVPLPTSPLHSHALPKLHSSLNPVPALY